jgi:hypothetical protein
MRTHTHTHWNTGTLEHMYKRAHTHIQHTELKKEKYAKYKGQRISTKNGKFVEHAVCI